MFEYTRKVGYRSSFVGSGPRKLYAAYASYENFCSDAAYGIGDIGVSKVDLQVAVWEASD